MEADPEVKGKGKSGRGVGGVGGFQRLRGTGDSASTGSHSGEMPQVPPRELLQQAMLLPKPRALRSYSRCPGTISSHLFADLGPLTVPPTGPTRESREARRKGPLLFLLP